VGADTAHELHRGGVGLRLLGAELDEGERPVLVGGSQGDSLDAVELGEVTGQTLDRRIQAQAEARGIGVVGRLRLVDVVIGMDDVVATRAGQVDQSEGAQDVNALDAPVRWTFW